MLLVTGGNYTGKGSLLDVSRCFMHDQEVAARTIEGAAHQWKLVAEAVHHRRTELGLTAKDVADRAGNGLSVAVLSLIENARQASYTVRTLHALCRALDWTPDSIEQILNGEEPEAVRLLTPSQEDRLEAVERELALLREQLGLPPRERNGGSGDVRSA